MPQIADIQKSLASLAGVAAKKHRNRLKNPSLLSGDQVNPKAPRRWLLVKREAGVPGEEYGGGRWSLDHLYLDQEGVPTLVEVKRSTDTRIRREVVGQMLAKSHGITRNNPGFEMIIIVEKEWCPTHGIPQRRHRKNGFLHPGR